MNLPSVQGEVEKEAGIFFGKLRNASIWTGWAGWCISVFFNILFITPFLIGDPLPTAISRMVKGETGLIAPLIANLIAAFVAAYSISHFEARGRASDTQLARAEMWVAYFVGICMNFFGMQTLAQAGEPQFYWLGRLLLAVIFEYVPERMLEGTYSFEAEKGRNSSPQPSEPPRQTVGARVGELQGALQGEFVDNGDAGNGGGKRAGSPPAYAVSAPARCQECGRSAVQGRPYCARHLR